jgi:CubicO group peptidase (beta-lactamase class C family)
MTRNISVALALVALAICGSWIALGSGVLETAAATSTAVDAELRALEPRGFSGAILWVSGDEVVLKKGYGFADREASRPVTADTIFDIGSITKPITAAAIWKLEADGKLSIHDRIARFFPNVPPDKAGITIDDLLRHTSGLDDIFGGDYEVVSRDWVLEKALSSKLLSPPGQKPSYSNAGYSLLAMIIEDLTGQPYEQYVHEHLMKPAGTPRIGYRVPRWAPDELAVGYRKGKRWGSPLDHPWADDGPSWNLRGNGGMLANVGDLYTLMETLQKGPSLPESARRKFMDHYVRRFEGGRRMRTIGGNGIFNADYIKWVDENVTLIMMTSVDAFEAEEITPKLFDRVRGRH